MPRPTISLVLVTAGAFSISSALAVGTWWFLPQWAPAFVCHHLPWVEPVARAAATHPGLAPFLLLRYQTWGASADVGMVRCLTHRDARVRELVAEALISQTPQQARLYPLLVNLLNHPDDAVHRAAVACLEKSIHPDALTTLIDHFWTCTNKERSDHYLAAISSAWRVEALPRILDSLTQTANHHDRDLAMQILSVTHQVGAFDAIVTVIQQEPHPPVPLPDDSLSNHAASALCAPDNIERLITLLGHDDARVRLTAAAALLYHSGKQRESAMEALRRAQQDSDLGVRAYALATLGELDYPGHAELFLQALHSDEDRIRLAGIYPYRFTAQDPRAVPSLLALLGDSSPILRPRVIEALCFQEDPRTIPALFACLSGQDEQTRQHIADALSKKNAAAVISGFLDSYTVLEPSDRNFLSIELQKTLSQMDQFQRERLQLLRTMETSPSKP